MRKIFTIISIFILSGCVSVPYKDSNELMRTDPYKFIFEGSREDLRIYLKRILVRYGFLIDMDDKESGILTTHTKQLSLNEQERNYLLEALAEGLAKQRIIGHKCRILFLYDDESQGKLSLEMNCRLGVEYYNQVGIFAKSEIRSTDENIPLRRGHPLNMRLRGLISIDERFTTK